MDNTEIAERFQGLNTAVIIDACLRGKISYRIVTDGIKPINTDQLLAGKVRPVKHYGSVDIFLEVMLQSDMGDILVIDNQGRRDEACVGDLTALEAKGHGLAGFVIWGLHRDERELRMINFPTFSYGTHMSGPTRLDQREEGALSRIQFGNFDITLKDVIFADINGVVFIEMNDVHSILDLAESIWAKERDQIELIEKGILLTDQFQFTNYLKTRKEKSDYTFRDHLRKIGGEIEE